MQIKEFNGRKYDVEKLALYNDKVGEKIEKMQEKSEKRMQRLIAIYEKNGSYPEHLPHDLGYCTFCGALRPSGEIGMGAGCEKICKQFFQKYYENLPVNEELQKLYFTTWKKFARYSKQLFLYHNSKNHDMVTCKSRNSFIQSFFNSMLNNKECKLSGKQIKIISDNIFYKGEAAYDIFTKGKKAIYREYNNALYKNKMYHFNSIAFGLYCRIQVAHAWI